MTSKSEFSRTMRIDLIPEAPSEPVAGKKKRIVVATPKRGSRPVRPHAAPAADSSADSRYQALLQSVYDAALIANLEGTIVDTNIRASEFLGFSREEFAGMTVFEVVSGADVSLINTLCENLENERFALIQAYCIRKDGSFFPSEIAVNKLDLGQLRLCFFLRDTTLRKQAEEMLMTEHNAIQNSGNGIAVADREATLEYVNPSVTRMWGFTSAELVGKPVRELMSDPAAMDGLLVGVMRGSRTWNGDLVARRSDGREFDVQVAAACNRNGDGEPLGVVLSFVDTTDRKLAEAAMREAERHRVMLESLGAACHHLSQPATVLMGNLEIMEQGISGANESEQRLVQSSIDAMRRIGAILHKLNAVNEYKTTPYLSGSKREPDASRILEI